MTATDNVLPQNDIEQMEPQFHAESKRTWPRRGGAPSRNRNGITSGLVSAFTTGRLPRGCSWVSREVAKMRRELEAELIKRHVVINAFQHAAIQSAARHEIRVRLLQRLLWANELPEKRIELLREISRATQQRDTAIASLKEQEPRTINMQNILIAPESIAALPPDQLNLLSAARDALRRAGRGESTPDDRLIVSAARMVLAGQCNTNAPAMPANALENQHDAPEVLVGSVSDPRSERSTVQHGDDTPCRQDNSPETESANR